MDVGFEVLAILGFGQHSGGGFSALNILGNNKLGAPSAETG